MELEELLVVSLCDNNLYIELTTNSGTILIKEPVLDMSNYFQGSHWGFSFACKFNCSQIHSSYDRLFAWGNSITINDSIHVSLTSNTSHNNGNDPCISFGNTRIFEDLNTGCPAL